MSGAWSTKTRCSGSLTRAPDSSSTRRLGTSLGYKIFDEILVNAADNFQRDNTMNLVQIEIDAKQNKISVWNNGIGIPIQMHKEHKCYVPEMIFG